MVSKDKLDLKLFFGVDEVIRAGDEKNFFVTVSFDKLLILVSLSKDLGWRINENFRDILLTNEGFESVK